MGVSGLLPLLKSIQKHTELKKYAGETFGVDAYGWLHRAAYSCALELGQGKPTKKYISAALHRVRMLVHFGVTPYMVFDGDYLPSKAATEDARNKSRAERKKLAIDLLNAGKPAQATQEFQKCIDITPEMASALIQQLKKMNIPYVVAPYEADSQLVYLERQGIVSGIISDDSDLLVFGAKKLLTKLDGYGNCIEINRKDFCAVKEISLTGWTDTEFRRMAIMSGCDYLDGISGVGLKTAYRKLRKTKSPERIVKLLKFEGKRIDENYLTRFYQAELTFLHQWVFCPTKKELVHLTPLDGSRTAEEMPFIGAFVESQIACGVAAGDLHPMTKAPIDLPQTPSKRRHSQTKTPTPAFTPSSKPLHAYFKGKGGGHSRIPMGNMDPNCFTVDPQRISLITHGGLLPRVFPLPRPYLLDQSLNAQPSVHGQTSSALNRTSPRIQRRRTEPIADVLSKMSGGLTHQRLINSTGAAQSARSDPPVRPQKKPRLCEETEDKDLSPKNSKFFKFPEKARSYRKSKSDACLLSDDSIELALSNLPDIDGFQSSVTSKPSIAIYEEPMRSMLSHEESQETSQATQYTTQTDSQDTIASSPGDAEAYAATHSFELLSQSKSSVSSNSYATRTLSTPFRSNLSRFSYSSSSSSTSVNSRRDSVFSVASSSAPAMTPATGASSRLTPLQRIGARALNFSNSPKPRKPEISFPLPKTVSGIHLDPSSVPLPKVDLNEVEALSRSCGSEDQIVPDSEGEDDELAEEQDTVPAVTKLNLSRFAFS